MSNFKPENFKSHIAFHTIYQFGCNLQIHVFKKQSVDVYVIHNKIFNVTREYRYLL